MPQVRGAEAHAHACPYGDTFPHANPDSYSNPHADPRAHSDSQPDTEPDARAHSDSQPDTEPDARSHGYPQPYAEPDACAHGDSQPDPRADARTDADGHRRPCPVGLPCAGVRDDRQSRQLLRKLRSSGAVAGYPHAQAYRYARAGDGNTDEKTHADPYKKTYSHAH